MANRSVFRVILTPLIAALAAGCGGSGGSTSEPAAAAPPPASGPVQRGSRLLEIDVTAAADGDFAGAFNLASSIGMQSISVSLDWTDIDIGTDSTTSPPVPVYQTDPDANFLAIANGCYPNSGTLVSLTLRPITTLIASRPAAIESLPFDDPQVIDRFEALIDFVYGQIPDLELSSLVIGSEVDLYLTSEARRAAYLAFYRAVSGYARDEYARRFPERPALKVAVETTHRGLLDAQTQRYYQDLNAFSDVVGVSYYPLEGGMVQPPSIVGADFDALVALYPGKPLYFYQLGYPSGYYDTAAYPELQSGTVSPVIGSSDEMQAAFVSETFDAWDAHATEIGLIDFTWLHDLSPDAVAATAAAPAFGGTSSPAPDFVEFLRTLGLRTATGPGGALDGGDKTAFQRLREAASARGWTDTGQRLTCN